MKFIVSSSVLQKNLQSIGGVLNTNNTLPILNNFLFELTEDSLTVSASDLETTMITRIPVTMSEEPGSVAIPARLLLDTLKTFSDVPLTFTIDMENFGVEITAGEGKYKLAGQSSEEFPKLPEIEESATIDITASIIYHAITKTIFATGNDELRQVMTGMFCELSPENITFVGTDSHKLVRYRRNDAHSDNTANFIIPKKPLNQLKTVLPDDEEMNVRIEYNETNALFTFENYKLVCRLIDGKYPNYEAVIPEESPNVMTIQRLPFLNAIKRVSLFSNQSTHQIKLNISGQELILTAEDVDFANEAKERLTCNYEGENIEIGFNSRFVLEMLNNIDTEEVNVELSEPNKAGLILPVDSENKEEDVLMLVMPVMLND